MECSTAECICGDLKFSYSAQRLFDNARIFCGLEPPTIEKSSGDFLKMSQMITEYCSLAGGFVLASMILTLEGQAQQHGR
jgi:hypothetical protein